MEEKAEHLTSEEVKKVIKDAIREALNEEMYTAIGRGMISKMLYSIGSGLVVLAFALAKKYVHIKGIE